MGWHGTVALLLCACLWRTAAGQGTDTLSLQFVSGAEVGFPEWTVPTMCVSGRIGLVQAYVQQSFSEIPQLVSEGGQFTAFEILDKGPGRGIQVSIQPHNVSTGKACYWAWMLQRVRSCVCVKYFKCIIRICI